MARMVFAENEMKRNDNVRARMTLCGISEMDILLMKAVLEMKKE